MNIKNKETKSEFINSDSESESRNVVNSVRRFAELTPDSIAIEFGNNAISYKELCGKMDRLSSMLWAKGIRSGDKIIVQLPNDIMSINLMLSIFCLGAIPIMTSLQQGLNEIRYIIGKCSPTYWFLYKDENIDSVNIKNEILKDKIDITVIEINDESWSKAQDLKEYYYKKHSINDKDLALILMSGGTSGVPKLIPRRHEDYFETSLAMGNIIGMSKCTVYLATMPISHTMTLYCPGVLGTLIFGGKIILTNKIEYDNLVETIKCKNVTITTMIPSLLFILSEDRSFSPTNLKSLKVIQVGGEKLHHSIFQKLPPSISTKVQHVYGMSEGMHMCTRLTEDGSFQPVDKLKPVFSDDKVMLCNESEKNKADEDIYELKVKGRFIIDRYFNSPEVDKLSFTREGFYKTGDLVTVSLDGHYNIVDRKCNVIIRSGMKVAISKLEELVLEYPDIKDCQVFGVADLYYGERIFLAVLNKERLTTKSVNLFLKNSGVSEYFHVDEIVEIKDWPKLPSGKVNKKELSKLFSTN